MKEEFKKKEIEKKDIILNLMVRLTMMATSTINYLGYMISPHRLPNL